MESIALPKTNPRLSQNNFDLLRLLFATTVCLVHAQALSGFTQLAWIPQVLSSSIAVKSFFVVSGFLIFMSYERSTSFKSYAIKRIRRIYPAYFAVVMLCAFGLVIISTKPENYFSIAWLKYLLANLSFLNFLQPTLPGVFESNYLDAVNGALWTLKIEVSFYLSVPIFVFLFRRFSVLPVMIAAYVFSIAYALIMQKIAHNNGSGIFLELGRQLPAQLCYFLSGAFFYYKLPFFEKNIRYFLSLAIIALIINSSYPLPIFEPFALATIIIFLGLFFYLGNFGKFGDFSYGVYILHFPIIQLILHLGWLKHRPWYFLMTIIFITAISAIAMWHIVEKRFLLKSSHYINAATNS
jgi:peptidoglycan/LPS O-acetylase OafA/YrhL